MKIGLNSVPMGVGVMGMGVDISILLSIGAKCDEGTVCKWKDISYTINKPWEKNDEGE
jgi:hypothetical protein